MTGLFVPSGTFDSLDAVDLDPLDLLGSHDRDLARPCCDYCGDDTDYVVWIAAEVDDRHGNPMFGRRICERCIDAEEFTGWTAMPAGQIADPLGRSFDPDGEFPYQHWSLAQLALAGRPNSLLRSESDLVRIDVASLVAEIAESLESEH